ncbi:MAG: hypothetical protein F4213_16755 [Boseongicola sp. SB0677_bin_26]|nr:hypothetical protein [Boseongicola sp. SB0665_bin_10]MYG27643.1 hypothetical protein [Boseongicola sp. SB0677_bin_26]
MNAPNPAPDRAADTRRFYEILSRVSERVGGCRHLANCNGRMHWPRRGVYFFFEPGECRSDPGCGLRVVRVGTHALKPGSRTSLWQRLSQHRGSARSGAGNHRGSIFRLIVGAALARRADAVPPQSWGVGSDAGAAARRLGLDRATVRRDEAELERRVSECIGRMPFLWLRVDDLPGSTSMRGVIERNAIALLSHARTPAVDTPSDSWLGAYSDREMVRASGLWNNRHVADTHDPSFLDEMETLVTRSRE